MVSDDAYRGVKNILMGSEEANGKVHVGRKELTECCPQTKFGRLFLFKGLASD